MPPRKNKQQQQQQQFKDPMLMKMAPPQLAGEQEDDDEFTSLQHKFNFLEGAAAAADPATSASAAESEGGNSDDFDADAFERAAGESDDDGTGIPQQKRRQRETTAFHRAFMKTLPLQVRRRVDALLVLDRQYQDLDKEREKKRQALFRKFEFEVAAPILLMRKALIIGAQEPTEELIEEGYPLLHATVGIPMPMIGDDDEEGKKKDNNNNDDDDDEEEDDIAAIIARRKKQEAEGHQGGAAAAVKAEQKQQKEQAAKESAPATPAPLPVPVHERGLPGFWLRALRRHCVIDSLISERDEQVLVYCTDVTVSTIEPHLGEGFIVRFEFAMNPFFRNKALVKTFHTKDDDDSGEDMVVDFTSGTRILWTSPDNNVTTKVIAHKVRSGGGGGSKKGGANKRATRTVKKQVRVNSFFRFFFDDITDPEDAQLEDGYEYDEVEEEQWMGLGLVLQDKLVPYAIEYYTHEATDGSSDWGADSEFEEEEDEEGWMSDDEEEEEDLEEGQPVARRAATRPAGAAAAAAASAPSAAAAKKAPEPKPSSQKSSSGGALSAAAKLAKAAPASFAGSGGGSAASKDGAGKKEECKQQ